MDFSLDCLDYKRSEFGILWYYGNNTGKVFTKELRQADLGLLLKFIEIHKDVIDYRHLMILFRGFFVIMLNRLELVNGEFKTLDSNVNKIKRQKTSEFRLILDDEIDLEADLLKIEPPADKKVKNLTQRTNKLLLREKPTLYQSDLDLEEDSSLPLVDDGFGGNIGSVRINVDDFFNLSPIQTDQKSAKQSPSTTPQQEFEELDFELPELNLSPISKASVNDPIGIDNIIEHLQQDDTLVQDSELQSREAFMSDRQSVIPPSFRSVDVSIAEQLSQEHSQTLTQESALLFESSEQEIATQQNLESNSPMLLRRKRKRKPMKKDPLIIDENTKVRPGFFKKYIKHFNKVCVFKLVNPYPKADRLFTRPIIRIGIEPIVQNYYSVEKRKTDLVIPQIAEQYEDEDEEQKDYLSDIGSAQFSPPIFEDHDFLDRIEDDNQISEISRVLTNELVDQVSMSIDAEQRKDHTYIVPKLVDEPRENRQLGYFDSNLGSHLESRIELQRDGSNRQVSNRFYSDFEPMMVQSDYTVSRIFSLAPRNDVELQTASNMTPRDSTGINQISFSFFDMILDRLNHNDGQITFSELAHGRKKRDVAKLFFDLLSMKISRKIEMIQHDTSCYSEIYIRKI